MEYKNETFSHSEIFPKCVKVMFLPDTGMPSCVQKKAQYSIFLLWVFYNIIVGFISLLWIFNCV